MNRSIIVLFILVVASSANANPIEFEDTSDKLGFERGTETWGLAWGNLNRDKWPDLWNSGHRDFPRMYRNTGTGDFEDVSAEYDAQMDDWWMIDTQRDVHAGAWGDYDKDGDDDLIVGDEDELFINLADSGGLFEQSFTETMQAFSAWIPSSDGTTLESETVCRGNYVQLIDVDNDGTLDRICADEDFFPEENSDSVTSLIPTIGNVSDTIVGDFNNDLRQDIIALRGALRPIGASKLNDTSIDIWIRGELGAEVTFTAIGKVTFIIDGGGGGAFLRAHVLELDTNGTTTGEARDVEISYDDSTGLWHVLDNSTGSRRQHYVQIRAENTVGDPSMTGQTNRDLPVAISHAVNNGNGFDWVTNTGLTTPIQCNSITSADFDNDMDLDLYLACGKGVDNTANLYYDNDGDGTFTLVGTHGGEGPIGPGFDFGVAESVVAGDYDVDGFMDLAVANGILFYPVGYGGPDTLLRNRGNGNHWIEMDLIGVTSNGNGMGAKVYVTAGGVTQLREQHGGYHRWSQDHQRIHVGLAGNTVVDEIRIEWPSGAVDVYTNVAADSLYNVTEETSLLPADLGPPVTTAIEADDECGRPAYSATYGPMIQLWRDCGTSDWHLRFRSGLGRLTENVPLISIGALVADAGFSSHMGVNFDASDSLRNGAGILNFRVLVQDVVDPNKTLDFSTTGHLRTCLWFGNRDIEAVVIGNSGKRLEPPFDITNGFGSCDSDGDTIPDEVDTDDDNDGVDDVDDAFPVDPTETQDSDGDGVGDNTDEFPNNPNEWIDSDGDGVPDNSDIDLDNDGLTDPTETVNTQPQQWESETFVIPANSGQATHQVDLSALPVSIGDSLTVSGIIADGDLNSLNEHINLDINSGEFISGWVQTGRRCALNLVPVSGSVNAVVTVVDIGGGVPGLSVHGMTTYDVDNNCSFDGVLVRLRFLTPSLVSLDQDSDAVFNFYDLDSDNDAIADVVEAGLVDADNNFLVDNLIADQGTITNPPDSDSDGIPDFLDLESNNPLNDGTDYDIDRSGHALLDTNGDGFLSALDLGGGIDLDADGIDSLIDIDDTVRGSTFINTPPEVYSASITTIVDVAVAIALQASDIDMQQLSYTIISGPANGQLSGTAPDLTYTPDPGFRGRDSFMFVVNDGHDDSLAATISIKVNDPDVLLGNWIGHAGGVTTSGNHVSYSGVPTGWLVNTVRSVLFSTLGFTDDYELNLTLESDPAGSTWVMGLGVDEQSADWIDVDYAFRNSDGQLAIYENGTWRIDGPTLQQGDVLSIFVYAGTIEYRHNGITVISSSYTGTPEFYVDTSFNDGATEISVVLAGVSIFGDPPGVRQPHNGGGGFGLLALLGLLGLRLFGGNPSSYRPL